VYAADTVLPAQRTSMDKAAAAEAESATHGDDDAEVAVANNIAFVASSSPTDAAV